MLRPPTFSKLQIVHEDGAQTKEQHLHAKLLHVPLGKGNPKQAVVGVEEIEDEEPVLWLPSRTSTTLRNLRVALDVLYLVCFLPCGLHGGDRMSRGNKETRYP